MKEQRRIEELYRISIKRLRGKMKEGNRSILRCCILKCQKCIPTLTLVLHCESKSRVKVKELVASQPIKMCSLQGALWSEARRTLASVSREVRSVSTSALT